MPRLHGMRERRDHVHFDTHAMEPGQTIRGVFGEDCAVDDPQRTNMVRPHFLVDDMTCRVFAFGLRLLGKTRDEEDVLLDFITFKPFVGDRRYGPYPGSLCSTLRFVNEDEEIHINDVAEAGAAAAAAEQRGVSDDIRTRLLPGYILQSPIVVPVRQTFRVELAAADALPEAVIARAMLFTLLVRDIC